MNTHQGWTEIGTALGMSGEAARRLKAKGKIRVEKDGQRVWATDAMLRIVDAPDYEAAEHVGPDVSVRETFSFVDSMAEREMRAVHERHEAAIEALDRANEDARADALEANTPASLSLGPLTVTADDEGVRVDVHAGRLSNSMFWAWTR